MSTTVIGPLGPIFTAIILVAIVAGAVVIRVWRELRNRRDVRDRFPDDARRRRAG